MGKILAIANQKGGVGKTTTAINIAAGIGLKRKKVLLVDFDPQGNATSGVGVEKSSEKTIYEVMAGKISVKDAIINTKFKNLDVLSSTMSLAAAEFELADMENREKVLKSVLDSIKEDYDYIIIDCPPSLGMLTINALTASDGLIIPMQCEYYSLEGLSQMLQTANRVKKLYNDKLELTGILLTMYNGRLNLSNQVVDELKKYYSNKLFKTTIARNVRLSEAPSYGEPIQYYDKYSKGGITYNQVADEILKRI